MPQTHEKNKRTKFYKHPTDRIDLMSAVIKAQAIEEAEFWKQKALKKRYTRKLEAVDVLVMHALIGHRNNKTGRCDPSQPYIASELGRSVSTIQRSMIRLKKAGFMDVIRKSNGKEQLPSQCNIHFERGQPWLEDNKDDDAHVNHDDNPVTEDDTPQSPVTGGQRTDDRRVQSPVTDELPRTIVGEAFIRKIQRTRLRRRPVWMKQISRCRNVPELTSPYSGCLPRNLKKPVIKNILGVVVSVAVDQFDSGIW